jgi:hypothetical protein
MAREAFSHFQASTWRKGMGDSNESRCFYEKVIKVKWPTWRPSVLVSYGTSSLPSLRLLFFCRFLFLIAFGTLPQKIWR